MSFYRNEITTERGRIVYWDTQEAASSTVLLLAPGPWTGEIFNFIDSSKYKNTRFISPNFSGRGGSTYEVKDLAPILLCADLTAKLLTALGIKEVTVVGVSFGTMVANYILDKYPEVKIHKLFLIAPGEYFNQFQRYLLKLFFYPTKFNLFQRLYGALLKKTLTILNDTDLPSVRKQWLDTLSYKISHTEKHKVPTKIFFCKGDKIVSKCSKVKLSAKYPNSSIYECGGSHPFRQETVIDLVKSVIENLDK